MLTRKEGKATTYTPKGCDYCGKVPDYSYLMVSPFRLVVTPDGVKNWDGCQEGVDAGAPELVRQQLHKNAVAFAERNKPYAPDSPCPKCGNPIRITQFKSGRAWDDYFSPEHPHIIRECGRCTFKEYEVPLDFDPDALYPAPAQTVGINRGGE